MEIQKITKEVRKDILNMVYEAGSGHIGGSMSCADILTFLYHEEMDLGSDKFILSKGHAAPALYAVLASKGIIPKESLKTLRKIDSTLEGHPSIKTSGVEVSTGSLGQGLSVANGLALAKKIDKKTGYVYVLLGDGEIEEGQVWEALMTSSKYNLSNLIIIIDHNGLQIDGKIEDVKGLKNISDKIQAFGIKTVSCDGHNLESIKDAFKKAKENSCCTCIIANTIKGKGISFMENNSSWHGKCPNEDEYNKALEELI